MEKKPLLKTQIPEQFWDRVKFNIDTFYLGNRHHKQICSEVTCRCGVKKIQRNLRVLQSIEKHGEPYFCKRCWKRKDIMTRDITDDMLAKIIKEYMTSLIGWQEVISNNNLLQHRGFVLNKINSSYLTKLRRIRNRRVKLHEMENSLLERERYLLSKQKEDLKKIEKSLRALKT